ncbi:MAG: preprotein translocase subunit SecE [Anaerohalosphaeraceae bacterium]|nr:preprotein translocase subunit SecE [Anaerohalosphaeraceae bacterium]
MLIEKYKWGQGKNTRLYSAVSVAVIAAIGCWSLYGKLQSALNTDDAVGLWVSVVVPLGLFSVFGLFVYWLVNRPSVADFLIAAEGELKKVSFSTKQEIMVSTTVVIVVVMLMAVLLGVFDLVFNLFFTNVVGI